MSADSSQVGISIAIPALDSLGIVQYVFTTRQKGLGARTQGIRQPDDWKTVAEAFGIGPKRLVTVNQVHGQDIVVVDDKNFEDIRTAKADAMVTKARGIAVGVETADCVPILLIDPDTPAAAAVHAGWRSTVKNIARKAVATMGYEFGSDPRKMIAAIGPAIGPECYEVDEAVMGPVRETFSFWREVTSPRENGRWSLDLVGLNRMELVLAGLPEVNVYSFGLCTCCMADLFYSYRREGRTGRMLSAVMLKP